MKVVKSSIIYDNPLPQLKSKQALFPSLTELKDGKIAAVFALGEAMESVDQRSVISVSCDGGETWSDARDIYSKSEYKYPVSECSKITALPDGSLITIGYGFERINPDLPVGNPKTGGLLDDFIFISRSTDGGKTFSKLEKVDSKMSPHVEASAPITVLKNGDLITPMTAFPDWEGNMHSEMCGRALYSSDGGKTWNDDAICMKFDSSKVTCYEQRMCQLESGAIINIAWCEDTESGKRLPNHYTASFDGGKTWTSPTSTGILGQASSVCAIGGERLIAIHAVRRDTERPGIYGYIVDFSDKTWNIVDELLLWEPNTPVMRDSKMADIFAFLKFGQPSAILLSDGDLLMTHWYFDAGQYKTVATRIEL